MTDPLPGWLDTAFFLSQWFTLPFFAMMVFAPRWSVSERVIAQRWWWLTYAGVFAVFLGYALFASGSGGGALSRMLWPTVPNEHANFALWALVPTSGTHITFDDLFIMRWIYLRETERPWPLQFVFAIGWIGAPLGLLAYTLYSAVRERRLSTA